MLQFYKPDSGRILFDGRAADDYPLTDIRGQVAIVPQDVLLFGGTIRENIAYGRLSADAEEIITAAQRDNAHEFIIGFPKDSDTLVGDRGAKFFGAQPHGTAQHRAL